MSTRIRQFVRELGLDAYVVGGAVRDELLGLPHRDEDFLVLGVDHVGLRTLLEPHGRVEDLEVHGQLVGVRLHPREPAVRELAPAGIEFTPPRMERSTGPGHRHFEIVVDASATLEQDMARRDFTVNAMARELATGRLIDPFGGREDLERRTLRTVTPGSFEEDPLRLLRALRLVSQLDFEPSAATTEQMIAHADGIRHVSAERIGGGLAADGMGELSKLLLGIHPARALRLARDTGVLTSLFPEFAPVIGHPTESAQTLDEHVFLVVQEAADAAAPLRVRLASLLHDIAKPDAEARGERHAPHCARATRAILGRLRYPTRVREQVTRIVAAHSFVVSEPIDGVVARRFLGQHGAELAFDLVAIKRADLRSKPGSEEKVALLGSFQAMLEVERSSPHRLEDLAIDGTDLIALGFREGPEIGRVLRVLLDEVIDDPATNEPEALRARARRELP